MLDPATDTVYFNAYTRAIIASFFEYTLRVAFSCLAIARLLYTQALVTINIFRKLPSRQANEFASQFR